MSALDEKTKAERALKDLQKVHGEQQVLFGVRRASNIIFFCDILSLLSILPLIYLFFYFSFFILLHLNICCHLIWSFNLDFKWYVSRWPQCYFWLSMWIGSRFCRVAMTAVYSIWTCVFFSPFKLAAQSQEISSLEDTVAALKEDYERSLSTNAVSQKDLQENLISARHDLLRVQEQLSLAEKVHLCRLYQQVNPHQLSSVGQICLGRINLLYCPVIVGAID